MYKKRREKSTGVRKVFDRSLMHNNRMYGHTQSRCICEIYIRTRKKLGTRNFTTKNLNGSQRDKFTKDPFAFYCRAEPFHDGYVLSSEKKIPFCCIFAKCILYVIIWFFLKSFFLYYKRILFSEKFQFQFIMIIVRHINSHWWR